LAWTKYSNVARDRHGTVIANVKIIVDYNSPTSNRVAALLEVKNWSEGTTDSIEITPSDASTVTWTEGSDFTASSNDNTTAETIASTINGTANFTASATGTGHEGNPYVSIIYTSGGYISSVNSTDTAAWDFYTINANSGAISKLASDDSGTIKHQPIFTNSHGQFQFYIDAPVDIDVVASKSGKDFDNTYTEDITVAT